MASLMIRLLLLFLLWLAGAAPGPVPSLGIVIAVDLKGDGRETSVADAAHLSYRNDTPQDMLSFRVRPFGRSNPDSFGLNIVVDTYGADAGRMNWWGAIGLGRVRVSSVVLMLDDQAAPVDRATAAFASVHGSHSRPRSANMGHVATLR
jgi:hypothetical protein